MALAASLTGCATAEPRYAAKQAPADLLAQTWKPSCSLELPQAAIHRRSNIVERGDEVEIAVTSGPNPADNARITAIVEDDGSVFVPKIGRMMVAGAAPRNIENAIVQTCFERGVPTKPLVEVSLKRVRQQQITVLGGVTRPGVCTLARDRSDLVSAIAAAGGLARNAGDKISIHRPPDTASAPPNGMGPTNITLTSASLTAPAQNLPSAAARQEIDLRLLASGRITLPELQDGDLVTVELRDPPTVHVSGLVQHPGGFELPVGRDFRVLDAIAAASGTSNKVVDTVVVCRKTGVGEKRALLQVSLREASRDQAENLVLVPGDIVQVDPTPKTLLTDGVKYVGFGVIPVTMLIARGGL